jgi:NAD(P)-dependent dehydrogenase (short-subunit alcohol dehydrogenase family)
MHLGNSDTAPSSYLTNAPGNVINPDDLQACLRVLRLVGETPKLADELPDIGDAVSLAARRLRKRRRTHVSRQDRKDDNRLMESTGRCTSESRPAEMLAMSVLPAPETDAGVITEFAKARSCYVCKSPFRRLHPFYHQLCPECATENFSRRSARADLSGRRALITGGRIKIGYVLSLKLLRDGAEVFVTTRFPKDAASRYVREPDYAEWSDRLHIHGLDLRDLQAVYAFADHLSHTLDGLDILINNAAQTIRREPGFYQAMYAREGEPLAALPANVRALLADATSRVEPTPPNALMAASLSELWNWPDDLAYNAAGRPRDPRPKNSWVLELPDVEPAELAEVMLVNAMSPFVLCGRLEPLMRRTLLADRYVVNVSAMEGKFTRWTKTSRHPHTNMAKAALNMLTRTAASRLAKAGIFMNSVDTGWVTEENPHPTRVRVRTDGFVPPLDEVDGAARVYDPIIRGLAGERVFGLFFKDYRPVSW